MTARPKGKPHHDVVPLLSLTFSPQFTSAGSGISQASLLLMHFPARQIVQQRSIIQCSSDPKFYRVTCGFSLASLQGNSAGDRSRLHLWRILETPRSCNSKKMHDRAG